MYNKGLVIQPGKGEDDPGIPATGSTKRPENPGAATDLSDERPHIFTHYFVGANSVVPAQFGDNGKYAKTALMR